MFSNCTVLHSFTATTYCLTFLYCILKIKAFLSSFCSVYNPHRLKCKQQCVCVCLQVVAVPELFILISLSGNEIFVFPYHPAVCATQLMFDELSCMLSLSDCNCSVALDLEQGLNSSVGIVLGHYPS